MNMKLKFRVKLSILIPSLVLSCLAMSLIGCSMLHSDIKEDTSGLINSDITKLEQQNESEPELDESDSEKNEVLGTKENEQVIYYTDCLSNTEEQLTVESSYIKELRGAKAFYSIDENGVLWAYKDGGEPVWLADHVIHVDASQNGYYMIFLTEDHQLYGMGQNTYGVLRQQYIENEEVQLWLNQVDEPVLLMENIQFASAGRESIAVLTDAGEVYWWGRFQAFTGTEDAGMMQSWEPKLILSNARYVVCSASSAAAIDKENNLWLWGCNVWGQCGVEGSDYIEDPVMVAEKVEMVWCEDFSSRKAVYERDGDPLKGNAVMDCDYAYTTIIRKNGGEYFACGIDLGEKEKTVQFHGGLMYPGAGEEYYTHKYSSEFLKIQIEEIPETGRQDNEI